jgi:hypothetical protein
MEASGLYQESRKIPWIIRIIYCNPHFPYPEYNFARLAVALAYVFWGIVLLIPGAKYAFPAIFAVIMPMKAWGLFSIFLGLFSFWRLVEFKEPTIFCTWINFFIAVSWWSFVFIVPLTLGFAPLSMASDVIVALIATYVYLFANVKVGK